MSSCTNDRERVALHRGRMTALTDEDVRRDHHRWFVGRRTASVTEPDGFPRVPLALAAQTDDVRTPLPVVAGEVLVATSDRDGAVDTLSRYQLHPRTTEILGPECRVRLQPTADPARAVEILADRKVPAVFHHVAAFGGRSKGGATPEPADSVPAAYPRQDAAPDGPLVVVIDTGIDRAASTRTDGWLDGVRPDDDRRDIDLLDTVDGDGGLRADGRLDLAAGHGTFVAGLVRRQEPTADVVLIRALDTDGFGSETVLAAAIRRAAARFRRAGGRGVLNLSLGVETVDDVAPLALRAALDEVPADVLVVAAAGNGRTGRPVWPAAFDRVLGVASVEPGDGGLIGSEWSNCAGWVRFSAFGQGVVSTFVEGTETQGSGEPGDPFDTDPDTFAGPDPYALWTGTSFATATVSGALARHLCAGAPDPVRELEAEAEATLEGFGAALPF